MSLPLEQAQFTINQLLRQHAQGAPAGTSVPGYDEALAKARYEAMLRHARTIYDSAGDAQTQQQDQAMQQAQHAEELRRAQQDEQIRQAQHVENIRRLQMDHAISTGQSIIPGTNGLGTQQPFDGMAPTGPFIPDGKGYSAPYGDQPAYPGPFTPTGKGSYPAAPWDLPAYPGPFTPTGKGYTPVNPWDMPAYPGPFMPDPSLPPTPPTIVPAPPAEVVPYTGGPATKSATPGGSWNTPSLFKGAEIATGVTSNKPIYDTGFAPWGAGRTNTDIMRGGPQGFGGFGSSTKPTTDTWRPDTSYNQASRNPGYGTGTNQAWMNFMGGAQGGSANANWASVNDGRYNSYVSAFGQPTWTANG